jgi:hypothetical protein
MTSRTRACSACREWTTEFNLKKRPRQESKSVVKQEFARKVNGYDSPGV